EASIIVNELRNGLNYSKTVKRDEFDKMCAELVLGRIMKIIQLSLQSINLNADEINDVILVGGTTELHQLQHYFKIMFHKSLVYKCTKEAIAIGCAIYSSITAEKYSEFRIQEISNFGYSYDDNIIIPKLSKLPKEAKGVLMSKKFHRQHFHQFELHEVLEERKRIIGEYTLIPKGQIYVEEPIFWVKIVLDENGLISVKYGESGSNSIEELFIKGRISVDDVKRLKRGMKQITKNLCKEIRVIQVRNQLRFNIDSLRQKLSKLPLNDTTNLVVRRLAKEALLLLESEHNDELFFKHVEKSYIYLLDYIFNQNMWFEMKQIV
ncbi:heat shock protein 68-like protein, partial [Leptotrombidium deliense]